jgi:hypothetical protein
MANSQEAYPEHGANKANQRTFRKQLLQLPAGSGHHHGR